MVMAAALLMRDGEATPRAAHEPWARKQFQAGLAHHEDPVHRFRSGLRFNPFGIAILGMIYTTSHSGVVADIRTILETAAKGDPASAHGFEAATTTLAAIDSRLPRAVLRCAFVGCIRPKLNRCEADSTDDARQREAVERATTAVEAEIAWITDKQDEPVWPSFPTEEATPRDHIHLPGGEGKNPRARARRADREWYVDHQAAAFWLGKFTPADVPLPAWMRTIAATYRDWTAAANGADLEQSDEVSQAPIECNDAYYRLVARCLTGMTPDAIDRLCRDPITCLPDEPFLDAVATILPDLDFVYFEKTGISTDQAVRLRTEFADRLVKTNRWHRLVDQPTYSIETHLGPALGAIFLSYHGFTQPPRCYVLRKGASGIPPFIPLLTKLAVSAPCLYTALLTLNVLEISPEAGYLTFGLAAAQAWVSRFPDDTTFWIDYYVGRRFCGWLVAIQNSDRFVVSANPELQHDVEQLLSDLVRVGVAEAGQLEMTFSRLP